MKAYLLRTVKRLKKEANWRSSDLKKKCIELMEKLDDTHEVSNTETDPVSAAEQTDEATGETTAAGGGDSNFSTPIPSDVDTADPYTYILKSALESKQSRLMDIALDALNYLLEHDHIKGKEIINTETQSTLMDDILETVCKCEDEYDDVIQVQVLTHNSILLSPSILFLLLYIIENQGSSHGGYLVNM
jgi:Dimerisation and cyclophilin-binding domain of Mon2